MKNGIPNRLVVLGGTPAFPAPLYVGRPNLPDRARLHADLDTILDRRWLTNHGPFVQAFETALAQHLGVTHCVAVCNATIGLEVAARALELTGEVIVPAFTFIASAHALRWIGLEPVFCDVDPDTHNIDPPRVAELVTPRTSAVMGVHVWGRPCDTSALEALASDHGIHLLFDAAHAFSCADRGVMVGNFGELEVFSFHATKFLNSFEGGAIATNSDDLARRLRLMINFGFAGYDSVVSLGTNGKMSEMAAAMGLASLERVEDIIAVNRRNHERYLAALAQVPGISVVAFDQCDRRNFQYVVVDVDAARAGLTRDELIELLWAEGVHARRYFFPGCHRMAPYAAEARWRTAHLPHTERLTSRLLTLPTGTAVAADDIDTVADVIHTAVVHADKVRTALAASRASV
jgi:dTDP-4-amino-4,6-dideoxygalactose transaminase